MRALASLVALIVGSMAAKAAAQSVAHEDLYGNDVSVQRAPGGALTLAVPGRDAVPLAPSGTAAIERVAVGAGTALVVRVNGATPAGAVVTGAPGAAPTIAFVGPLGARGEDLGERFTTEIVVRDLDGDGHPDVVIGERHQDVTLCGIGAPLIHATAIAPSSLQRVHVSLNPLRADLAAQPIPPARPTAGVSTPDVPVLSALAFGTRIHLGESDAAATVLTDHDAATVWSPSLRDAVSGTATSAGIAAERVVLTAPPAPAALPARLAVLLVTEDGESRLLDAEIPATQPGGRVAIPIVPSRPLRCVGLVVTQLAARGATALAEVQLATAIDHDPNALSTLVHALDGAHADQAELLLDGLGERAVVAVSAALPTLSDRASRAAIRVLARARTDAAARALVGAMGRSALAPDVREALQRFGPSALAALGEAVATDSRAADLIATVRAPLDTRLHAMAGALHASPDVWRGVRGAARALVVESVGAGALDSWLALTPADPLGASRALALAAEAANEDVQRGAVAARARSFAVTSFEDRFRMLFPLAGDADGRRAVESVAANDPDDDLRWEAVRSLAHVRDTGALIHALEDRTPRVRVEAARGLANVDGARDELVHHLGSDPWPSVRAAAATALAGTERNAAPLLVALDDPSLTTTRAVIEALARTPSTGIGERLMAFAEDSHRNPDLRSDAVGALAQRCDHGMVPRLIALVNHQVDPVLPPPEQAVGHAALAAIAHIDPARARALLRQLDGNAFAVAAVERAAQGACPSR